MVGSATASPSPVNIQQVTPPAHQPASESSAKAQQPAPQHDEAPPRKDAPKDKPRAPGFQANRFAQAAKTAAKNVVRDASADILKQIVSNLAAPDVLNLSLTNKDTHQKLQNTYSIRQHNEGDWKKLQKPDLPESERAGAFGALLKNLAQMPRLDKLEIATAFAKTALNFESPEYKHADKLYDLLPSLREHGPQLAIKTISTLLEYGLGRFEKPMPRFAQMAAELPHLVLDERMNATEMGKLQRKAEERLARMPDEPKDIKEAAARDIREAGKIANTREHLRRFGIGDDAGKALKPKEFDDTFVTLDGMKHIESRMMLIFGMHKNNTNNDPEQSQRIQNRLLPAIAALRDDASAQGLTDLATNLGHALNALQAPSETES